MSSSRAFSPLELDTFFETIRDPAGFEPVIQESKSFIKEQINNGRKLVIITSGGTIVPLERQMVRFLDNFSAGTRGAISAEWFLRAGYAVIFLHRQYSFKPFSRKFRSRDESILDYLEDGNEVSFVTGVKEAISETFLEYTKYKDDNKALLMITFFTVSDYLYLLMEISKSSCEMGKDVMFYLAAAVSDFYLPENRLSDHKIQSDEGTLTLKLEPVPKLIHYIVTVWAPESFVVTFKLETDPSILMAKSLLALKTYRHQVVIGNMLKDRKKEVVFVESDGTALRVSVNDPMHEEIEERIVSHLVQLHAKYAYK